MVKTNILNLLATLHAAGVRVNLLNDYNPATLTSKADENKQVVRFEQTNPYYKLPKYEISSAGNLNITLVLEGKAHNLLDGKKYDAINFKCISIVKNQKLFKQKLDICPEDADLVRELGFDVEDDAIDLTKFDLVDGLDGADFDALAKACVEQYVYESFRERSKRVPKVHNYTPAEKLLVENGYDPETKVWSPIVTSSVNRVGNTCDDPIGMGIVNEQKTIPRLTDIQNLVEEIAAGAKKKISPIKQKLLDLANTGYVAEDHKQVINTYKYSILMRHLPIDHTPREIDINGVKFSIVF